VASLDGGYGYGVTRRKYPNHRGYIGYIPDTRIGSTLVRDACTYGVDVVVSRTHVHDAVRDSG
jgi:hypothetical protein